MAGVIVGMLLLALTCSRQRETAPGSAAVPNTVVVAADPEHTRGARERAAELDEPSRSSPLVTLTVRDLADGSPVAGIVLRGSGDEIGPALGPSGPDGSIQLGADDIAEDRLATDPPFRVAGLTLDAPDAPGTCIWVYSEVEVAGTVSVSGAEVDNVSVHVSCKMAPGAPGAWWTDVKAPWSKPWLQEHRLYSRGDISPRVPVRTGSQFRIRAPRIRGLFVMAAPVDRDFRPDGKRVPVNARSDSATVDLEIRRAITVSGNLVPPTGQAVDPDLGLDVYVGQKVRLGQLDHSLLGIFGNGATCHGNDAQGADSVFEVTYHYAVRMDSTTGAFRAALYEPGECLVTCQSRSFLPEQLRLGWVSSDRSDVAIHLRLKGNIPTVQLTREGEPLIGLKVWIVDGSAGVGQPAFGPVEPDASGRIDTGAFVAGREYFLIASRSDQPDPAAGGAKGWITWQNQGAIDVAKDLREKR